jgi:hypothetical protein
MNIPVESPVKEPDETGRLANHDTIPASGQPDETGNPVPGGSRPPRARTLSNNEREIPLRLIPHMIALEIRKMGDKIYRISVKRTHWHHYNISVRTKPIARELIPVRLAKRLRDFDPLPVKRMTATGADSG